MQGPRLLARSRLGNAAKNVQRARTPETIQELDNARRDYAAEALAEYVQRIVDTFPPLTQEQLDRIAVLLRPAVGRSTAP